MIVSVCPTLGVIDADCMIELVFNGSRAHTPSIKGHTLTSFISIAIIAHRGRTFPLRFNNHTKARVSFAEFDAGVEFSLKLGKSFPDQSFVFRTDCIAHFIVENSSRPALRFILQSRALQNTPFWQTETKPYSS